MQGLYRLRLSHAMEAVRELARKLFDSGGAHEDLVEDEFVASIEAVRDLDAAHLERLRQVHLEFDDELRPMERPSIQRHREELAQELGEASGLCVAGGHVVILLNRLRLFDPIGLVGDVPIFAWSAGAMVLGPRVVVFHDSPPQGPGNAEVLEAGLGLYEELVPLPHAAERLQLEDPLRVCVFARRFAPDACVTLDPLAGLIRRGGAWDALPATSRLSHDGRLVAAGGAR